jgi:hypothetical protein
MPMLAVNGAELYHEMRGEPTTGAATGAARALPAGPPRRQTLAVGEATRARVPFCVPQAPQTAL